MDLPWLLWATAREGPAVTPPDESWRDQAACQGLPGDLMVPVDRKDVAEAKRVCAVCPVIDECREHALAVNEQYGVWGGLDENERAAIRRARREAS